MWMYPNNPCNCIPDVWSFRRTTFIVIVIGVMVLIAACSVPEGAQVNGQATRIEHSQDFSNVLPNRNPKQDEPYSTILEPFEFTNRYDEKIQGYIRRPDPETYPLLRFAAVIKIPGGINPGRSEALTPEAIALAEAGMVVVTFNSEGRVDVRNPDDIVSQGQEDYNGFRNQDTLADLIAFISTLPFVNEDNIGLRSQSYGLTMAAGCVGRYPELPIRYIVDGEGPPSSFVTVQEPWALFSPPDHPHQYKYETVYSILGHYSTYRDPSSENEAFWREREAVRYIGNFRGRYLRLQGEWDHSQPPSQISEIETFHQPPTWWQGKHACEMVNAALDGGVPWVRVNLEAHENPINQGCDQANPPIFIPGELNANPMIPVQAVLEMAREGELQP
jgi:hypothetical protein